MNTFGKLASVVSILSVVLLAAVAVPASAGAGEGDGFKIYDHRSDDLRLKLAVKGSKVYVKTLKYHSTCEGSSRDSGWSSFFSEDSTKIKKGGLFGFKTTDDFGQFIHIELRARLHEGTIRGWFFDMYSADDEATGESTSCWTGKSMFKPKLKFKAHLVV